MIWTIGTIVKLRYIASNYLYRLIYIFTVRGLDCNLNIKILINYFFWWRKDQFYQFYNCWWECCYSWSICSVLNPPLKLLFFLHSNPAERTSSANKSGQQDFVSTLHSQYLNKTTNIYFLNLLFRKLFLKILVMAIG